MPLTNSPLSGMYFTPGVGFAYLFDAAIGPGRFFGGHACLVIEAIIDGMYTIERAEIFANIPSDEQKKFIFHLPSAAGLVSAIKLMSHQVDASNTVECAKVAKKVIKSSSYELYTITHDQFASLQRVIREEQINFVKAFIAALQVVQRTPKLEKVFLSEMSHDQKAFLKKNLPEPQIVHLKYSSIPRRFLHYCAITLDALNYPGLSDSQKHGIAMSFLSMVSGRCFLARSTSGSSLSSASTSPTAYESQDGLFMNLFFKLQYTDDGDGGCLLPDTYPRFRLSGPQDDFKGDATEGDFVNCLAWAKYVLKKATGIQPKDTNVPKKIGTGSCMIQ